MVVSIYDLERNSRYVVYMNYHAASVKFHDVSFRNNNPTDDRSGISIKNERMYL